MQLNIDYDTEVDGFSLYALVTNDAGQVVGFLQIAQGDMAMNAPYGEDGIAAYTLTGDVQKGYVEEYEDGETEVFDEDIYFEDTLLAAGTKVGDIAIGNDDEDEEETVEGQFGDEEIAEYEQAALQLIAAALQKAVDS